MSASRPKQGKRPREATVSSGVLRELLAAAERGGVARHEFLKAAQLRASALEDLNQRWPISTALHWTELALDLTRDPAFGLHWGEWLVANLARSSAFSLFTTVLAQATTLRQAFALASQYGELQSDELGIVLVEHEHTVELHGGYIPTDSLRVRRVASELTMRGFYQMLKLFGAVGKVQHIDFDYVGPDYAGEYTQAFDGLERFEQPFTRIIFDRALMDAAGGRVDTDLQRSLRELAERRIEQLRRGVTYALRVRDLLAQHLAPHQLPMSTVAGWLRFSERSLNRRLAEEGWSYRAIAEAAATRVARRLLVHERRTIRETAAMMGFSETSAFHRAFKRWTGTTPRHFGARR